MFLYGEEEKVNYDLKIYFVVNGEFHIVYDNEDIAFTNNICNNLLNAPSLKDSKSLFENFRKNKSYYTLIGGGCYEIVFYDENNKKYEFSTKNEEFVYNNMDNRAYKYNFTYDFYKYITYKNVLQEYLPTPCKEYWLGNHYGRIK